MDTIGKSLREPRYLPCVANPNDPTLGASLTVMWTVRELRSITARQTMPLWGSLVMKTSRLTLPALSEQYQGLR